MSRGPRWTPVSGQYAPSPFSVNRSISIVDDGMTIYAVNSGFSMAPYDGYYFTAPVHSDAGTFTRVTTTPMIEGRHSRLRPRK